MTGTEQQAVGMARKESQANADVVLPEDVDATTALLHLSSAAEAVRRMSLCDSGDEEQDEPLGALANDAGHADSPNASALPCGWERVMHDSGLPCYVHQGQLLVCWSRPYVLDSLDDKNAFYRQVKSHVPPLSVFGHRHSSPANAKPSSPSESIARTKEIHRNDRNTVRKTVMGTKRLR